MFPQSWNVPPEIYDQVTGKAEARDWYFGKPKAEEISSRDFFLLSFEYKNEDF